MKQNKVIGLTGGIASGKTVVSDFLKEEGYCIVDADIVAREAVEKGSKGLKQLTDYFSDDILIEGKLNRKKLREIIFSDKEKLEAVNQILHPIIRELMEEKIKSHKETVFLVAPLLFENKLDYLTDEIWLISCDLEIQIERVMKRDQSTKEEAISIIHSQMSLKEKEAMSDVIIYNNSDIDALITKVKNIIRKRVL